MKKVMFAAALAAGMVAVGDGVESGIVGYTTFEPGASVKCMKGFNFQNTSGGAIDLQSIVAYADGDIDAGDGYFKIWWWSTQSGNMGNKYAVWSNYWWDENDPNADEDGYVEAADESEYCWVVPEDDDVMPTKWVKSFFNGEGFFVQAAVVNPSLTISGAIVPAESTDEYFALALVGSQKKLITNPFPVAWNLSDIVAYSDGDIEGGDGAFKIWWWSTQSGNLGNKYAVWSNYWWDESLDDYVDAEDESEYCWVVPEDDDVMPVKWTKSFGVGEGFFVQAAVTAPSLMFPNPFYKAP